MSTPFPFEFVTVGTPVPFSVQANPDFPTETQPVCILTNLGTAPAPDTFITVGAGIPPNDPDPWEVTFHWSTLGGPMSGQWQLDAFLHSISATVGNQPVTGGLPLTIPGDNPGKFNRTIAIGPDPFLNLPPGVFLFQLYATLRWIPAGGVTVRVAGRAVGPLIELYHPG
jgi:hypothetical protein